MTAPTRRRRKRQRGSIETLPSGALRVRVYAGTDPITGRRHYLREIISAGPGAQDRAEEARRRLLTEISERRNPRTSATVNQLLDRHLAMHDGGKRTVSGYRDYLDKHVRPFIGHVKVGALEPEVVDSLYAELRRCREHCTGRRRTDHRTNGKHECDERCRPHQCEPLANATIRKIHYVLNGAYKRAIRWRWVATNPISQAEPPAVPSPDPQPPTPEEAARLLKEAWRDPDWGTLVWLTMTTGARRGELCALRWQHVNLVNGVLTLRRSIAQDGNATEEKDTKTHQRRHVTLDPESVAVLTEHWDRCRARASVLGVTLTREAYVFSLAPDGSTHLVPSAVTQRYKRMAHRIGIDTHLHNLRHYSATELIAAGVDVRTVAGRLGHGGGGTTTLRVYAAWVAEADQRAAAGLLTRLPERPAPLPDPVARAQTDPQSPYERIAAELRAKILDGTLPVGEPMPTGKELAKAHCVSPPTAHRALTLVREWGLVEVSRGQRAIVRDVAEPAAQSVEQRILSESTATAGDAPVPDPPASVDQSSDDDLRETVMAAPQLWTITLRGPDGRRYPARHVREDIDQPDSFRAHLLAIARIEDPLSTDGGDNWIGDYELEVRDPDEPGREPARVLRWQKD